MVSASGTRTNRPIKIESGRGRGLLSAPPGLSGARRSSPFLTYIDCYAPRSVVCRLPRKRGKSRSSRGSSVVARLIPRTNNSDRRPVVRYTTFRRSAGPSEPYAPPSASHELESNWIDRSLTPRQSGRCYCRKLIYHSHPTPIAAFRIVVVGRIFNRNGDPSLTTICLQLFIIHPRKRTLKIIYFHRLLIIILNFRPFLPR